MSLRYKLEMVDGDQVQGIRPTQTREVRACHLGEAEQVGLVLWEFLGFSLAQ